MLLCTGSYRWNTQAARDELEVALPRPFTKARQIMAPDSVFVAIRQWIRAIRTPTREVT